MIQHPSKLRCGVSHLGFRISPQAMPVLSLGCRVYGALAPLILPFGVLGLEFRVWGTISFDHQHRARCQGTMGQVEGAEQEEEEGQGPLHAYSIPFRPDVEGSGDLPGVARVARAPGHHLEPLLLENSRHHLAIALPPASSSPRIHNDCATWNQITDRRTALARRRHVRTLPRRCLVKEGSRDHQGGRRQGSKGSSRWTLSNLWCRPAPTNGGDAYDHA